MVKLKKKEKFWLGIAGVVILLFVVQQLVFSGLLSKLKKSGREVKLAEATLKRNLKLQGEKDQVLGEYEKFEPYLQLSSKNEKLILAELLKEIESIVSSVGGSISNLTPQEQFDDNKEYAEYRVVFRLELSFLQLLKFLSAVQESEKLIRLDKFTAVARGEEARVLNIDGVVSLVVPL
ncbi:MAG: hypothetical protein KAJ18_04445 [Candidatus Omnitrophica bacterium]|nr:hypothetical protein [Candidatus Omnitrophota bacterium]